MICSQLIYHNPTADYDWTIQKVTCSHYHLLALKNQNVTIRHRSDSAKFRMLLMVLPDAIQENRSVKLKLPAQATAFQSKPHQSEWPIT